jgi:protein-disulfide isomerase
MHKDARSAALAMQAAKRQNKAWEMHDKMFAAQGDLSLPAVTQMARELELDVAQFTKDMGDPEVAKEVDKDAEVADSVEARGTPTFFINGRRIRGARPLSSFKKVIEEEIEKANKLLQEGTSIEGVYDVLAKNQKEN